MKGIDTDLLERSSIKIRLDITNQHIAYTLQMRLVEAFQHFLEQLVRFSERNCLKPKRINTCIPLRR